MSADEVDCGELSALCDDVWADWIFLLDTLVLVDVLGKRGVRHWVGEPLVGFKA